MPAPRAAPPIRVYCPPSAEARRLRRRLGALAAPVPGADAPGWRRLRHALVAPYTQLTFLSFDLQMFLFDVLHRSLVARLGHGLGMAAVVVSGLALAAHAGGLALAGLVTALLLAWYAAVALDARLPAWGLVMVPVMGGLLAAACALADRLGVGPLLAGLALSGALVALSHAFEVHFPPRAGDPLRWVPMRVFLLGPAHAPHAPGLALRRLGRVAGYAVLGWFNELWASPRLLPYNVLRLLLAAGYAPTVRAELDDRVRRAWASGEPALDFVGEGGGAFLPADA